MKLLLIFLVALMPMLAQPQPQKPTPAKKATGKAKASKSKPAAKPPVQQSLVPKGAEKINDNEWRHVDKDGKAWIYRKTPFGVAKLPEEKALETADAPRHAAGAPLHIRDLGDSIEFSRRTPFGMSKWQKKKTELNEQEQAAYDAFQSVKVN